MALSQLNWLRPARPRAQADTLREAAESWMELARQPSGADVLDSAALSTIDRLLDAMPAIDAARKSLPTCLCHGDCHAANLLLDATSGDGRLVWADWQEVGLGRGPEDLSFFVQRAMGDGAALPEGDLMAEYHGRLSEAVAGIALEDLRRVYYASELRTRLLEWPHYLAHLPPAATALDVRRISEAAARLGL